LTFKKIILVFSFYFLLQLSPIENHAHAKLKITTWRERDFQQGVSVIFNLRDFAIAQLLPIAFYLLKIVN
jgi:hypothetical protein